MELGVACGGGSTGDGVGDGVEAVVNGVGWCDSPDGEVVVTEVDSVRDAEGLGFGIDDAMAVVMLQGDANIEFSQSRGSARCGKWLAYCG